MTIKNQSKYTSYDITGHFAKGHNISDQKPISSYFQPNNHLDGLETRDIELEKMLIKSGEDVLKIVIEDGVRVLLPGTKFPNAEVDLKPKEVDDIKFYLKYKNEFGHRFYTRFRKSRGLESNTFSIFRPYVLSDLKYILRSRFLD